MVDYTEFPKYRGLVIRRNSDDLKDWVDRANQLYSKMGAVQRGNPPEFIWPSGSVIRTGHLKDEQAYSKYLGHEYHKILLEELTQIPEERMYLRLLGSCRSSVPTIKPHVFATTNPGGKGHFWVKNRFVDSITPGETYWYSFTLPDGRVLWRSRIFIQSTIDDNPSLMLNDPGYVATLEEMKKSDPKKYRAWRFGDWNVFEGQVFGEFTHTSHVIKPMIPNTEHDHVLWIDWGYAENSAFAGYLTAIIPMKTDKGEHYNQLITYKEFWGNKTEPGEWARKIYEYCMDHDIKPRYGVTDPSMHSSHFTSKSIAKMMTDEWMRIRGEYWIGLKKGSNSGNNSRVNRVGVMHGWLSINPASKVPYWLITENCKELIETLPMAVHDPNLIESYAKDQNEHGLDSVSYGLEKVKFTSIGGVGGIDYNTEVVKRKKVSDNGMMTITAQDFADMYV